MSKVYVVTVYNSLNSGSFLQATSLYNAIKNLGYDVSFLDTGARDLSKQAKKEFWYMAKKLEIRSAFAKFVQAKNLTRELEAYDVVKYDENFNGDDDIFVLGSDEIWNVARKDMASYPIFWGKGLPLANTLSYAPSLNNATKEDLEKYSFVNEALEGLKAVSVRDTYSHETVSEVTDREILEVCDPTLLMPAESYDERIHDVPEKDYILIYIYKKAVSEDDIAAIVSFAKKHNKKLVAFGSNFGWCDKNVTGSAFDFLSYIKQADYVCTSTFHGTLFSTLFLKKYVVLGNKNRKVGELLKCFGIDRKCDSSTLEQVIDSDYDYEQVKGTISAMRDNGLGYLKKSIDSIMQ